jgi:hypothetical protein
VARAALPDNKSQRVSVFAASVPSMFVDNHLRTSHVKVKTTVETPSDTLDDFNAVLIAFITIANHSLTPTRFGNVE